jgi:tight adherence protein B
VCAVTIAALALAFAVVAAPRSSRHRLIPTPATRRRLPAMAVVVASLAAMAMALPVAVTLAAGIVVGTNMLRRRRTKAQRAYATEAAALQSALDVLVGELRVGAHPVAAIDVAAREVDGPVAESLRGVAARARLGADVAAGIRTIAASSRLSAHWERLALFWGLAQTHGLAIATLMRAAHRDLVERDRFSARVDAGMAGARTTAAVLAGLPVLGIGLGELIGAEPLGFLLSGGVGGWLLAAGVTLACCGLVWSDRITSRALT